MRDAFRNGHNAVSVYACVKNVSDAVARGTGKHRVVGREYEEDVSFRNRNRAYRGATYEYVVNAADTSGQMYGF